MKKLTSFLGLSALALATAAGAVKPAAVGTIGEAFDVAPVPAGTQFLFTVATTDPNGGPPNGFCLATPECTSSPAGILARVAYVGTLEFGGTGRSGEVPLEMVSLLAFNACDVQALSGSPHDYVLRFNNMQNFNGVPMVLNATFLPDGRDVNADGVNDRAFTVGDRVFLNAGPNQFGAGFSGVFAATASAKGERASNSIGSIDTKFGLATFHRFAVGAPPVGHYQSFDSSAEIRVTSDVNDNSFSSIKNAIRDACEEHAITRTYEYNCTSVPPNPAGRAGAIDIHAPIYIAVTATAGSGETQNRLQANNIVDNLIHLQGDCDFAGEPLNGRATLTYVDLIAN